ncbi:hypothetical protein BJ546DRAFT_166930 [Cryomyces antarcticus]|uniref:Uncharacterized protein n=1 Tax=Cryomyces antarcticus TaxID=329879 RepID=A0ABR0KVI5_9PEZI|nr:hypothetical protein LTR16_000650 [Cryomyces antarcticus]
MSDLGDEYGDEWLDIDENYMYLDDASGLADDLAEHAIPSPALRDEHDFDDEDVYEYFGDLEYGVDTYYDAEMGLRMTSPVNMADSEDQSALGEKRKRTDLHLVIEAGRAAKRRRNVTRTGTDKNDAEVPELERDRDGSTTPVRWISREERSQDDGVARRILDGQERPFSLLPHWREQYEVVPDLGAAVETSTLPSKPAIKDCTDWSGSAAHGHDRFQDAGILSTYSDRDEGGDKIGAAPNFADLDPDVLKTALRHRLESSGLSLPCDESTLMGFFAQMLDSEGTTDGIAGQLADQVLDRVAQGAPDAADISQWLAQQGVALRGRDEEPVPLEEEIATYATPTDTEVRFPSPEPSLLPPIPPLLGSEEGQHLLTPSSMDSIYGESTRRGLVGVVIPRKRRSALATFTPHEDNSTVPKRVKFPVQEMSVDEVEQRASDDQCLQEPIKGGKSKGKSATSAVTDVKPTTRSRKRKAEEAEAGESAPKPKRPTRSYAAATASSKGKATAASAAPAKSARSGRVRRG